MCWPMTDKATVASQIGQRAQPSWSAASDASLRDEARGVSSMWNYLSAYLLDSACVFAASELDLSALWLCTISVALACPRGATAAQNTNKPARASVL